MSELISRKSVLDKIEKSLLIDELTVGEKAVLSDVATMISLEPTVDTRTPMANIVEKLEEYAKSPICDNHMYGCPYKDNDNVLCENCGAYGAIEIVKQEIGVINNEPTNN